MSKLSWLVCTLLLVSTALAQAPSDKLRMVVIVTRHGVRPPLDRSPKSPYAKDQWPLLSQWGARCPGDLTETGAKLATLLGGYYTRHYIQAGLLQEGCPNQQIYIWADNEERTEETAEFLATGLAHGCAVRVDSLRYQPPDQDCKSDNKPDYFFHPLSNKDFKVDQNQIAAIIGRLKQSSLSMRNRYRAELTSLQSVVLCCDNSVCSPLTSCTLLTLPDTFSMNPNGTFKWIGPFSIGSTDSENFLLEYANGMPCDTLGWGRVAYDYAKRDCNPTGQLFRKMQRVHIAYFEMVNREHYLATIQGSNLANQILLKLQEGAAGRPSSPLLIYAGHDTNIATISGMLHLSWPLSDLPGNDTPPAGALVFELYEDRTGNFFVKLRYVHATMDQMRTKALLSLSNPPEWSAVKIPGCANRCAFPVFQAIMNTAIDRRFTTSKPDGD